VQFDSIQFINYFSEFYVEHVGECLEQCKIILNCKAISMYNGTYKKINNCYLFDKTNLLKKTNNEFTSIFIISNSTEIKPTTTLTTTTTTFTTTTTSFTITPTATTTTTTTTTTGTTTATSTTTGTTITTERQTTHASLIKSKKM
jgi:hypothetical protein